MIHYINIKIGTSMCNMICHKFNEGRAFWFKRGLKYCPRCEIAVKPTYRNCPCCKQLLRVTTHNNRRKEFKRY